MAEEVSGKMKNCHHYMQAVFSHPDGGEDLAAIYDEWADTYSKDTTTSLNYTGPAKLAYIACDIIKDKSARILDAASGTGMVGAELKVRGFTNIDALDPSRRSLDECKKLQAYTNYIIDTLDDHETDIPSDCYDAILMCGTFGFSGHVTEACFPELIRITKPGGYIMFTVSTLVLDEWRDRLDASITSLSQQGLWQLVETRWCPYRNHTNGTEKIQAMVPILKISQKAV